MIAQVSVYSVVVPQAVCDHGVDSVHICAEGSKLDLLWVLDQVRVRIAPRYGHFHVSCCLAEDCPSAWMKKKGNHERARREKDIRTTRSKLISTVVK